MVIDLVKLKTFLGNAGIKLETLESKTAVGPAIDSISTTALIPSGTTREALNIELVNLGDINAVIHAAEGIFQADVIENTVNNKIKKDLNKQHEYDLSKPEFDLTLGGLKGVTVVTGTGVKIVKEDADKLTVKIDPATYKDGEKITLKGNYKKEDVILDTVQFKAKDISAPAGTLDKDSKTTVTYPVDLTDDQVKALGAGDTFKVERVTGDNKKVTVSLKEGKSIDKDTKLPEIELDVSGRKIKTQANISKATEAAGTEEGWGNFWSNLFNWNKWQGKTLYAVVIAVVAFFGGRSYSNS